MIMRLAHLRAFGDDDVYSEHYTVFISLDNGAMMIDLIFTIKSSN